MSLLDITSDDFNNFKGVYEVSINKHTEERFLDYINTYEKKYLQDLLGCKLYDLFEGDLDSNDPQKPQDSIYQVIYNPFCIDDTVCYKKRRSEGMVIMLTAFIYFEWIRDQRFKPTGTGIVVSDSENSNMATFDEAGLYRKYNIAIETYKAIQWYICENLTDYPTYEGVKKEITSYL